MKTHQLLEGDCVALLPTLAAASVQAFITSPPYWGLRDYGIPPTSWPEVRYRPMSGLDYEVVVPAMTCCLGLEPTPEAFIGHLLHVFRLAAPALAKDGTCWVNLGDTYAAGKAKEGYASAGHELGHSNRQSQLRAPGLGAKNLVGIPWRFALAMQADGWLLRQDIIWAKPNPMPESVTDRCTKAHEYIFLFARQPRYYFNAEAIAEAAAVSTQERAHLGQQPAGPKQVAAEQEGHHNASDRLRVYDRETRNKRSVWTVATKPYSEAHFATFPPDLITPCILAGTRPGDVVCDMFSGSGTTGQEAIRRGRPYIGIEAKPENIGLHKKRFRNMQFLLPMTAAS